MDIYNYDRLTGELRGQSVADLDPIEGLPLIPAHATEIAPPVAKAGFASVFMVLKGVWTQVEDNRGPVFDTVTLVENTQFDLGPLPANMTKIAPPSQDYSWDGKAWVLDPAKCWARIRSERARLVFESDWTQLADVALTAAQKAAWATYRQALRDITTQADPLNITWPVKPV